VLQCCTSNGAFLPFASWIYLSRHLTLRGRKKACPLQNSNTKTCCHTLSWLFSLHCSKCHAHFEFLLVATRVETGTRYRVHSGRVHLIFKWEPISLSFCQSHFQVSSFPFQEHWSCFQTDSEYRSFFSALIVAVCSFPSPNDTFRRALPSSSKHSPSSDCYLASSSLSSSKSASTDAPWFHTDRTVLC
jgi:hypothetical protein